MNRILPTFTLLIFFGIGFSQNGKILRKKKVTIAEAPIIWRKISYENEIQPEFKHIEKLDFYFMKYKSDSLTVNGFIIEPKKEGKYPVVIFNRGGNRSYARVTLGLMVKMLSKLAAQGYVIIGSDYRKEDEFGGAEINDVLSLTETIKELPKADITKIGMFGWSRGGMMTYLSLKKSKKIKTAIVGNGVSDLFATIDFRPIMETKVFAECIPKYWENKEVELKKRSAYYWVNELNKNSSLLILAGTKDKRVNHKQADKLAQKLNEIKYNFELKKFETNHFFSGKKEELDRIIINWFNQRLKHKN